MCRHHTARLGVPLSDLQLTGINQRAEKGEINSARPAMCEMKFITGDAESAKAAVWNKSVGDTSRTVHSRTNGRVQLLQLDL